MFQLDISLFRDASLIFVLAFLIDIVLGEYPDRIHPTVAIGKVISFLKPKLKNASPKVERANGVLLVVVVALLFALPVFFVLWFVRGWFGSIPYIIIGAILFKSTFAVKCMRKYTAPIAEAMKNGDLEKARKLLPYIVRRDPYSLNERQIVSAAVESIAESTTDGITAPFFFFALLGVPGAFAYRVVNTLDSMVGYKNAEYKDIGWFSAKMDTLVNYVPARLTAVLMVVSAWLLRENAGESWRILKRDKGNTASPNAGWTISAMAGALNTRLEKQGYYALGDDHGLYPEHILRALRVMEMTAVLFGLILVLPVLALRLFILGI
jgi:adenosylcobinamide-phosphate synthase